MSEGKKRSIFANLEGKSEDERKLALDEFLSGACGNDNLRASVKLVSDNGEDVYKIVLEGEDDHITIDITVGL